MRPAAQQDTQCVHGAGRDDHDFRVELALAVAAQIGIAHPVARTPIAAALRQHGLDLGEIEHLEPRAQRRCEIGHIERGLAAGW